MTTYKFKDDPEHTLSVERTCTTAYDVKVTEDGNLESTTKEEVIDVDGVSIFCHTCGCLTTLEELKAHGIAEYWEEV